MTTEIEVEAFALDLDQWCTGRSHWKGPLQCLASNRCQWSEKDYCLLISLVIAHILVHLSAKDHWGEDFSRTATLFKITCPLNLKQLSHAYKLFDYVSCGSLKLFEIVVSLQALSFLCCHMLAERQPSWIKCSVCLLKSRQYHVKIPMHTCLQVLSQP